MVSNKFQKIFEKFWKMADFRAKNAIFRVFRVAIFDTPTFYEKVIGARPDAPNDLIFGTNVPWGIYKKIMYGWVLI